MEDHASGSAGSAIGDENQMLVMMRIPPPHFRPDSSYAGEYGDDMGRAARRRIAQDLAHAHHLTLRTDWPMPILGVHCFVMEMPEGLNPDRVADELARDPRVEWAQPMHRFHTLGGGDPLYPLQPSAGLWHLSAIHQVATGNKVRVAVVDSSVESGHPDLAGQVEFKENFVDGKSDVAETHGTAVAGIIAARADNGIGIVGVAPQARLLALRACWETSLDTTECNSFSLGKALQSAILHHAQVINLSLTGPSDRLLRSLLDAALARGIKLVGAIDPHSEDGGFPASHPGVLAVADQSSKQDMAGALREHALLAPGHDIPTTVPGARWNFVSGSSFAAAHVSGLLALLTELQPALAPSQLHKELVTQDADIRMAGVVDVCSTLARVTGACSCSCADVHAAANRHP
ncbi:hypothetical protein EGT07_16655 [Herbaspirillum sp. HC18]|nr:hypothetical protein EGT07_16655 [Herbaspirillum sp. HC18]